MTDELRSHAPKSGLARDLLDIAEGDSDLNHEERAICKRAAAFVLGATSAISDIAPMRAALEYIAKGYSGKMGNCEGHSGSHCAEVAREALKKAAPQAGDAARTPLAGNAERSPESFGPAESASSAQCVVVPMGLAERTEAMFRSVDPNGGIAQEWLDVLTKPVAATPNRADYDSGLEAAALMCDLLEPAGASQEAIDATFECARAIRAMKRTHERKEKDNG